MKRIISMILVAVIMLSMSMIPAFAYNVHGEKENLFLEVFFDSKYHILAEDYMADYYYDEVYYHYVDESDPEGKIDWAIVYALSYIESTMMIKRLVSDRVVTLDGQEMWFPVGWALYDAQTQEFISIDKIDISKYDGLEKGLEEAGVGYPLGDANHDGVLSILDATYIQRVLVQLCEFEKSDELFEYALYGAEYDRPLDYISDIDGDGERTVLDATAIQRKLAQLD